MKQIILSLMVITAMNCKAQDSGYLELWNKYVDECNQAVKDTITTKGVIRRIYDPYSGDVVDTDTAWDGFICPDYVSSPLDLSQHLSLYTPVLRLLDKYNDNVRKSNWKYKTTHPNIRNTKPDVDVYAKNDTGLEHDITPYGETVLYMQTSRLIVCDCKLRKPDRDDFWEWLKKNGHRK